MEEQQQPLRVGKGRSRSNISANQGESFETLLTQNVPLAIERRVTDLENQAHGYKIDTEAAKTASFALSVAAIVLSANPTIAIFGLIGGAGYLLTLVQDFQKTKKLLPIPILRKPLTQLFTETGEYADTREVQGEDPIDDIVNCLSPNEGVEYELLVLEESKIAGFLQRIPSEMRLYAYRYALRRVIFSGYMPTPSEAIDDYKLSQEDPLANKIDALENNAKALPPETQDLIADFEKGLMSDSEAIDVPAQEVYTEEEDEEFQELAINGKTSLVAFLKKYQKGWLWDLIDQSPRQEGKSFRVLMPIMIIGAAGSYKSYFGSYIALARLLLNGHRVEINDPHGHKNRRKAWASLLAVGSNLYGVGGDYGEIADRISEFVNVRCKEEGDDETPDFTPIWDEVTNYSAMPETKNSSELLLRMQASDARKLGEAPIVITHNDTNEALGGSKGMQAAIKRGFIKIRLDVDQANGSPLFKGVIEYPEDSRGNQVIREISFDPEWLHPEKLLMLLSPDSMSNLRVIKSNKPSLAHDDLKEAQYQMEKALKSTAKLKRQTPKIVVPSQEDVEEDDSEGEDDRPIHPEVEQKPKLNPESPEEKRDRLIERLKVMCDRKVENSPNDPEKWWVKARDLQSTNLAQKLEADANTCKQIITLTGFREKALYEVRSINTSIQIRKKP